VITDAVERLGTTSATVTLEGHPNTAYIIDLFREQQLQSVPDSAKVRSGLPPQRSPATRAA
jgi:hypothetical protein